MLWRNSNERKSTQGENRAPWSIHFSTRVDQGLDADSEGEEGKFYVWSAAEIDTILGADAALFKEAYDVNPVGNWEGKTILNRSTPVRDFTDREEETLAACGKILLAERDKRIRPGWDDKVLADWNGLMIAAMTEAGAVFGRPDWITTARTAFAFVCEHMVSDGRIFHSFRNGLLKHVGTLDDYAGMIRAALVLAEITGEAGYLETAESWAHLLDRHYWDTDGGGYFFTAEDAEALIVRTKTAADHATPSGNGVMVAVLAQLYYMTGKEAYRAKADALVAAFSGEVSENFFPLAALMNGIEILQCGQQVVIVGHRQDPQSQDLLQGVFAACLPNRILTVIAPDDELPATHPAAGKTQMGGMATAFVCVGTTCSLPLTDKSELMEAL